MAHTTQFILYVLDWFGTCSDLATESFEAGKFVFRSAFNMESSGANAVETVTVRSRAKSIMKAEGEVSYSVWHILSI